MDNIKTRTGLSVEESVRMTEDRDKWRKYIHGVASEATATWHFTKFVLYFFVLANPWIKDG